MPLAALQSFTEMNSIIGVMAGFVILMALVPLAAWAFGRLGSMGTKVWEDQKNEIDMEFYRPRFDERRREGIEAPEQVAQRGRYDLEVEELLAGRRLEEATAICEEKLAALELPGEQREMYERYLRVLGELREAG